MYENNVCEQEVRDKWVQLALRSIPPINRCNRHL